MKSQTVLLPTRRPLSRGSALALCIASACLLPACTTQAWYESAQETQRQQCRQRYPDAADQQKCIDEVNSHTYNQYQQDRGDGAR